MPNLRTRKRPVSLETTQELSKHDITQPKTANLKGTKSRFIKIENSEMTASRKRFIKTTTDVKIPAREADFTAIKAKQLKFKQKANRHESIEEEDSGASKIHREANVEERKKTSVSKQEFSKVLKYQVKNRTINGQKLLSYDELSKLYTKRLENFKGVIDNKEIYIFRILCDRFEIARDVHRAAPMSKYMRNQFDYFGIPTPKRRDLYKDLWNDVHNLSSTDLRILANQTWFSPEREFHYFTVEMLEKEKDHIFADEVLPASEQAVKTMAFVREFLIHPKSWWDTVDTLAPKVVGPMVKDYPDQLLPILDEWNVDKNTWLCRTSILHQLSFKASTNVDLLFRYCLNVAHKEEFFIRKAIGWALREYYKIDPDAVRNFVFKNEKHLSPLSVREALKNDSKN